jgi:hypothetical protein
MYGVSESVDFMGAYLHIGDVFQGLHPEDSLYGTAENRPPPTSLARMMPTDKPEN